MHVEKSNGKCPKLQVYGTDMKQVEFDTYLGDIISADGTNTRNINSRVGKGIGKMNEILNMLEKISLGQSYFKIALLLRESMFLSSVLTNADVWTGLRKNEVKQLEDLDSSLLRQFLGTPCTVPTEAVYLELGVLNIGTILKSKRINFLHTLLKQKENSMLYNFFLTQWKYPGPKDEWTEQVNNKSSVADMQSTLTF